AVNGAANALTHLSGLSDISFSDVSNVISQLTSAAQGQSIDPTRSLFSTNVTIDVGGLGAGFDGIELDTFAPADITRIVEAQNANRALYTDVRQTLNSVVQFINQPPQALQVIKQEAPKWVIGGTILGLMGKSGSSSINSFPRTKVTSTSPQPAAPTESDKVVNEYFLVTVPDTPVKVFQTWIKGLPDKGAGVQEHYDWPRVYQTYLTRMTHQEAEVVNKDLIVGHIAPNQMEVTFYNRVNTRTNEKLSSRSQRTSNETRLGTRRLPEFQLWRRYGSALHLRMLSTSAIGPVGRLQHTLDNPQFDYLYEGTAGAGADIYVYDAGFQLNHQEFAFPHPAPEFAPLPGHVPMADGADHGDRVAALAVGDGVGVASRANLVAVKMFTQYTVNKKTRERYASAEWDDTFRSWHWIVNDMRSKNPSRVGKTIINVSAAYHYSITFGEQRHVDYASWGIIPPESHDLWLPLLVDAWAADIVTVVAAGNQIKGKDIQIGALSPQRFASPLNPLIVVGSVDRFGLASGFNTLIGAASYARGRDVHLTGEITVYAMGEDVVTPVPGTYDEYSNTASGTSFSAPQIAGLAAYFLTLPGHEESWRPGHVAQDMKNFIRSRSRLPPVSPDGLLVAYNGVEDFIPFCDRPGPYTRAKPRGLATIIDHIANIFKRKKKDQEIVIFEHGKFTDPKYSGQVSLLHFTVILAHQLIELMIAGMLMICSMAAVPLSIDIDRILIKQVFIDHVFSILADIQRIFRIFHNQAAWISNTCYRTWTSE
ncbi:MAG: hypothetical protein Q9184_008085, partial [Pyrenodesmia sp. 2 TL-2023]